MANIKLNFSSQWPNIQVAKVITSPATKGDTIAYPYIKRIKHGMPYPPLVIGFRNNLSSTDFNSSMEGVDVDDTYIYIDDYGATSGAVFTYIVVYALDISQDYSYTQYTSEVGDVIQATGPNIDLRKFLLHSRAVSPMVLAVTTKNYTTSDLTLTYTHPLNYPIFNFGYVRWAYASGSRPAGVWQNAPLASQAFPWLRTDGFTSILGSTTISGQLAADKGTIITLRNPAIISDNSATVTI